MWEVHCPNCGEFSASGREPRFCPRCGSDQVIALWDRPDIRERFKEERQGAESDD